MKFSLLISCALIVSVNAAVAQPEPAQTDMLAPIDLTTPTAAAHSMMRAMYQGDADMVDQVFLEGAQLRRISDEGELNPNGLKRWRDWVGTLEVGAAHEDIFGLKAEQFDNLATVWAPFVITYNDNLAGCGVNQLTLTRIEQNWQIVFVMDVQAPKADCATFKADHLARAN